MDDGNTYVNGKSGIHVATANDSFRVDGMGFVYLEHAVTIYDADALSIHDNFIAECGNCIELRGWGQASKITDNLVGAGFKGHSIFAENHGGLLITANNVFPRGASSIHLAGSRGRASPTTVCIPSTPGWSSSNRTAPRTSWPRTTFCVTSNRGRPFSESTTGGTTSTGCSASTEDLNSVIGNHFSEVSTRRAIRPAGATPVVVRLVSGSGNFVSTNHVVALDVRTKPNDSAFSAQVEALLTTEAAGSPPRHDGHG